MEARAKTIRLVRLAMAASLVVPLLFFVVGGWVSHRWLVEFADERLLRSLDVQHEQALNAFSLIDVTLNNANELVVGMSDADVQKFAPDLHAQFRKLVAAAPVVQSIWIFDKDGRPLATSGIHPPPDQTFFERDFIQAHLEPGSGTYIGQVYKSVLDAQPVFTVSRRLMHDNTFVGVLDVSVLPSNFVQFFSTLVYAQGLQYALIRGDGVILARYPETPEGAPDRLDESTTFRRTIANNPQGGLYTTASAIDGVERRFAVRRYQQTPLYLTAGIATSTIREQWFTAMAPYLIFGIPATVVLFVTLFAVLKRTEDLYAEMDRRMTAEDSLRQSQKLEAVGQLTGGVAHDFNNLLTIIIGNLELAQRALESWSDGAQVRLARRIDNAMHGAQRAAALTKRLLAFSRQTPLNPTALDVNRLLNGLSEFMRRALAEEISLEIVGGAGLWPVEADATELEAAILNLALNARDAMPGGGKLTVEASNAYLDEAYCRRHDGLKPGQYVQIAVTDTGTGMTKQVLDHAFEPFFTTKPSGQGTGLGLSQVYGFVKQSGGHVQIYSEVGEGTTIKVYLPRLMSAPLPQVDIALEPKRGQAGECILVVEDDADVRTYVVETLDGLGYEVLEAADGDEALRLIDKHKSIDVLLTDVVMPGMNGRNLAEEALRREPRLKVLFMTGYSRNAIVHQGRLDPGVALLQKPLTSEQLTSAIRHLLDA
jgi:two-component system NtrC family sensor kinase